MNQELMTLDFWQDTVIYEGKTFPVGTLACDALNVPADTITKMNEQCEKINLLLGMLNAGQDTSALFPMAKEAALTMLEILSKTPPFSYMDIPKHRERIERVFTADNALKYVEFAIKAVTNSLPFEEVPKYADAVMLQRYTAVCGHLAYSLEEYQKAMLDFAEQSDGNEADRTAEGFAKMFGTYFPPEFSITEGNAWMSTLNNSVQYISVPNYVFNSVFVAVVGVILTVTVCSLAGYAFAKMDFKGNDKLFIFLIMTMVVPSEVIIIPLFLIIKNLGWLNTFKALILPLPTAFGVFIMRQAILDIPDDLINAAKIDGCGRLRIFFKVVLPMVKSSIIALSIFTFVGAWNNFLWPMVSCSKQEMKTLPLALGMMKTLYNTDVGLTMACAVINFLPPFIFYVFMQSKFKEGMTLSGIKG